MRNGTWRGLDSLYLGTGLGWRVLAMGHARHGRKGQHGHQDHGPDHLTSPSLDGACCMPLEADEGEVSGLRVQAGICLGASLRVSG